MHVRACFVEYFKIISSMNNFSFNVNIVNLEKRSIYEISVSF